VGVYQINEIIDLLSSVLRLYEKLQGKNIPLNIPNI